MRGGFAFSIGFHALVLALIIFGLPFMRPRPLDMPPMISVELVEIAKQTTTNKVSPAQKVVKEPAEETPPPQPPKPQPQPQPEPQPRPKLDESTPDLAKVDAETPELKTPDIDIKPQMTPAPKLPDIADNAPKLTVPQETLKPHLAAAPSLNVTEPKLAELTTPAKIDLKRPAPKPTEANFDAVLKNLSKLKPQDTSDQPPQPQTKVATRAPSGAQAPLSAQLTASELDAVTRQLNGCMNWPDAALSRRELVVTLSVTVNPDRTVASARVVDDRGQADADAIFAASARAALRAVRVSKCNPLELPADKYQTWQEMTVNLTPPP